MKKIFIGLAVMAALLISVAPSMALIGIDDNVPGVNPLLPFFLVDKADYAGEGLDTLFVAQEIGGDVGTITQGKVKGALHWVLRNYKSAEVVDDTIPYTPNDVIAISVKDVLKAYLTSAELTGLETTIGGRTFYTGYMNFENSWYFSTYRDDKGESANNFVAFMYVVDLPNGWAAANTAPVFEDASDTGYNENQQFTYTSAKYGDVYTLEPYSGPAYAVSRSREMGNNIDPDPGMVDSFKLLPRFFLKDANAETWIPIWSSDNKAVDTGVYSFPITVLIYDNDEDVFSKPINIPYELNWFDIRTVVPEGWTTGGWVDIPIPDLSKGAITEPNRNGRDGTQWLAYSYQTASAAGMGNWSVLTGVHREIGTFEEVVAE
jgi:hypothetical protein